MEQTGIQKALAELGLPGLKVIATVEDIETIEKSPACKVRFSQALVRAIDGFARNAQGSENGGDSVVSLLMDTPEQHELPANPSAADVSAKLLEYLKSDKAAAIVLLTKTTIKQEKFSFLPENGETMEDNWIFRILLPSTLDLLIWAIVDISGTKAGYCYAVE